MVGRAPKQPLGEQLEVYVEHKNDLLNTDRTLKPRTAEIFEVIGKKLDMTSSAVHLSISRNMDKIFGENNFELKPKISKEVADEDVDYCYEHATGTAIIVLVPDELP